MPDKLMEFPPKWDNPDIWARPTSEFREWLADNYKNLHARLLRKLTWYGYGKAVYFTPKGTVRHTFTHVSTLGQIYRKIKDRWTRSYVVFDKVGSFPYGDWANKHFTTFGGRIYYFHELSGETYLIGDQDFPKEIVWEFFNICPQCGQAMSPRYQQEVGTCYACSQAAEKKRVIIRNYSLKPFDQEFPKKELRFGVELELVPKKSTAARSAYLADIRDKLTEDIVLFKRDGSIGESGVEVVTAPLLSDEVYAVADIIFQKAHELMSATSTCGLHIHVSKAALTELQRGKIIAFLNKTENDKFLETIAGRQENSYCEMIQKNAKVTHRFSYGQRQAWSRYTHYNISPAYSDEFRLFASTTSKETFLTRYEFVKALLNYCAPGATSLPLKAHAHYRNFVNWVTHYRKFYPSLFNQFVIMEAL